MHHAGEHEEHGPQTEDREDVRGENDQRLLRDGEDRRHGIDGEDDVGDFEEHEADKKRRGVEHAGVAHKEILTVELGGHRDDFPEQANDRIFLGVDRFFRGEENLYTGEDQENSENPDDPVELHERGPERDEDDAEDQRTEDPEEEHAVLILRGNGEVGEHDDEDEHVVHREGFFDDVAGQEFERRLVGESGGLEGGHPGGEETGVGREFPLGVLPEAEAEQQREGDPRDTPAEGFLEFDLVCGAMEDAQVEGEHAEHEEREAGVEPPVVGEREENQGSVHGKAKP